MRVPADQSATAGLEVNAAAAQLSTASDELAATPGEQSAAVNQATATTEELARASAAIADTVDDVARQTDETQESLQYAEAGRCLQHPHPRLGRPGQRHRRPDQTARPQRRRGPPPGRTIQNPRRRFAMEKGAKQMQLGLALLVDVTDANNQGRAAVTGMQAVLPPVGAEPYWPIRRIVSAGSTPGGRPHSEDPLRRIQLARPSGQTRSPTRRLREQ